MNGRDKSGRRAAWLITIIAAAGLLGLGWWLGYENLAPRLERAGQEAARQADRAGRLLADNRSLEQRLGLLQNRLDKCRKPQATPASGAGSRASTTRMLSRGQAVVELDGKVAITLERVSLKPRRAMVKVKVLGGRVGRALLAVGSELRFRVSGLVYSLVIRRIFTTSVSYSLIQQP